MHGFAASGHWMVLDSALLVIALWLAVGVAGVLALRRFNLVSRVLFPLGGVLGLALFAIALVAIFETPEVAVLSIGLPSLPFHLRLDSLSAFFLMVIGCTAAGVSAFAAGYFRRGEGTPPGLLCLEYHLFLASMVGVVLADDAYAFMVMWETMAVSSFFLVIANHRIPEIRRAGYLYLLIAHIGAIGILMCFGVLQADTGDYTFANMRGQHLSPFWASVAFMLALFGFGAKAGLLPLHVWLPEAHPAAPSPVSALMSGVMLKTAIYGLLRVLFDLLHTQLWWWGGILLALGLATALFGVVFAAVQVDMKRLLAYSSIENIGLLVAGIGLALVFSAYGMLPLAALALTASLYHVATHALFKSLLFLGTGSVLHATAERNLGKLGGLIRTMPFVAGVTLIGVLASAGLPPFGGFVSEWLLLQSFLFTPGLPDSVLNMLIPIVAALIALVAALAGYTMVKFFGVIFLGQPREEKLARARDAGRWERAGMLWLVTGCIALGLMPVQFIRVIAPVTRRLVGADLGETMAGGGWLLVPTSLERASYGPVIFLLGVAASCALAYLLVRRFYHGRLRRAPPWDCGYPWQTARMQDTAEGFGQPIRQIFEPFFRMQRELPAPLDTHPRYRVVVEDPIWHAMYLPIGATVARLARLVGLLQLRHADRAAAGGDAMSLLGALSQLLEIVVALALAPLLTGWVNQWRAWLQNKSAPSLTQPYRVLHKLFNKDSVVAEHASPIFRSTPYVVFGCVALACSIIPTLSTDLPLSQAADVIALVGLFALARVFIALAAMDVGTAFGSLGARREMLIGFLAEPALLMVLFSASLISKSTSLTTMVETLAHRELAIYPGLAFAGVAFVMVSLAENARVPVDNPATHLELTMIHEAMILEYSGRHLALLEWAASLKLFAYSCIGLALFFPWGIAEAQAPLALVLALPALVAKLAVGGIALALLESVSAKMRIFRVPEFLATAFLFAVIGLLVHILLATR